MPALQGWKDLLESLYATSAVNAACDGEGLVMQVKRIGEISGIHEDIVVVRNEGPLQTENFQTEKQGDAVGRAFLGGEQLKEAHIQARQEVEMISGHWNGKRYGAQKTPWKNPLLNPSLTS